MFGLHLSRRQVLRGSLAGSLSFVTAPWWQALLAAETKRHKATACIVIFLEGGPSHIDTFDPKPGAATNGPFEAIDTKIAGVKFSQHLPKLAQIADKLAVIRSLHSPEGDHARAVSLLHTGYQPSPALTYPGLGSTLSRQWQDVASNVPLFVAIGNTEGPGILGPQFGAFMIQDVNNPAAALDLPEGFGGDARVERRLNALENFNQGFAARAPLAGTDDFTKLTQRADRMRRSQVFRAFDPATAEPELFEQYGGNVNDGYLARACLQARRFVEAGVRFVEIKFDGWDTHADNFNQVQNLSAALDAALATLIADLSDRGLLDKTLIACFGEFGRTPKINGDNGRDHFPDVFSAMLAGGGLKTGQVIGKSNDTGSAVQDREVKVPDLHATLFTALGLDVTKDQFAPDGRLLRLTNNGQPIRELLT